MTAHGGRWIRWLGGLLVLIACLALPLLYQASRDLDFAAHHRNLDELRRMQALDAGLDQSVIGLRFGLLESYDPVVTAVRELEAAERSLDFEVYRMAPDELAALGELRLELQRRIDTKVDAIETFKTTNAGLRNSLAYLPMLGEEVIDEARAATGDPSTVDRVRRLMEAVLLYSLETSEARNLAVAAEARRLRTLRRELQARPDTAPLAQKIGTLLEHIDLILVAQTRIKNTLGVVLREPIRATLDRLDRELNEAYNELTAKADLYRRGLALLVALLLGMAALAVWRLWASARRLDATVRELNFQKFALDEHAIVAIFDAAGATLLYANERFTATTGMRAVADGACSFEGVLDPHEPRSAIEAIEDHVRRGKVWRGPLRCRTRAGGVYFTDSTIVPFADADGRVFQFVLIQTDVSERWRYAAALSEAKDRAEAAIRAKSAFLANMSHELRTPLNAVTGYSELLLEEGVGERDPTMAGDLRRIHEAAQHLLRLVNDLLELSRIEAGRAEVAVAEFALGELLARACADARLAVEGHGNALVLEPAGDLGTMRSDRGKIERVLGSLLRNAGKFTRDGRVTVSAERSHGPDGETVTIAVADTGSGMSEAELARIMAPFEQAEGGQAGGHETGLGLAIARRLAELLGGRLTAESRSGQGSVFRLTLPAMLDGPADTGSDRPALPAVPPRPLILIIDDDPDLHTQLRPELEQAGFKVASAYTGEGGLRLAAEIMPAAILLDVVMPGIDGWTVLRELRADPRTARIPVLLLTIMENAQLGLALGASAYLRKPATGPEIAHSLRAHTQAPGGDVLIVDDDPRTREMLQRIFRRQGVAAHEVADGSQALAWLEAHTPPGVIILDLAMPVTDGFAVIDRLAGDDRWRDIPVIVLTAKDLTGLELSALRRHVQQIFQKGRLEREALMAAVRAELQRPPGPSRSTG